MITNFDNTILKKAIALVLTFFTCALYSQTTNSNEITSYGNAILKVKPDVAIIEITVEKENEIEKEAIKELNEEVEKVQQLLLKLGFTSSNIKISEYKISNERRFSNENKKTFIATNSLILQFSINNKLINSFYQELQNENFTDLSIEFEAELSDELEKDSRKTLVKEAIKDAKINAENIASALNLKLGNVKHVSKGFNELAVASYKNLGRKDIKGDVAVGYGPKTSFDKFEVQEEELEENITIIYEIIKK